MFENFGTILLVVTAGLAFGWAWRQGHLARLAQYIRETREELRKCTWPTWDELKGSTVLIAVSIIVFGVFTMVVDYIFVNVVHFISKV